MEQKKLLNYAQEGASEKGMMYLKKSENTSNVIKQKMFYDLHTTCMNDLKEINQMIEALS